MVNKKGFNTLGHFLEGKLSWRVILRGGAYAGKIWENGG